MKQRDIKKEMFGVLETDDKLYYVIWNTSPFTSKSKAISNAIQLNKEFNLPIDLRVNSVRK